MTGNTASPRLLHGLAALLAAATIAAAVPAAAQETSQRHLPYLGISGPDALAETGTLMDAERALSQGRFEDAEAILRPLAERGDVDAQVALADLYFSGRGGRPRDYGGALELYEDAAESGDMRAMLRLSFMYSYGVGTRRDSQRAESWERRAVEAGSATAMNNLAYTYAVEGRNLDEALALIRGAVAVEPQNGHFLDTLGWVLYRSGRYEEAVPPLCRAVQLMPHHPEARIHLGDAYWRIGDVLSAEHQWRIGVGIFDDPVARNDEDIRGFLDSESAVTTRLALESRLSDGLPNRAPAAQVPEGDRGIEATYLDECQIPTT